MKQSLHSLWYSHADSSKQILVLFTFVLFIRTILCDPRKCWAVSKVTKISIIWRNMIKYLRVRKSRLMESINAQKNSDITCTVREELVKLYRLCINCWLPVWILSRQGGPSIVLPLHYYWLLYCHVPLPGDVDSSYSWWKIFSLPWICHLLILLYSFPYLFPWRNVQDDPLETTPWSFQSLIFLVSEYVVWLLQCVVGIVLGLK